MRKLRFITGALVLLILSGCASKSVAEVDESAKPEVMIRQEVLSYRGITYKEFKKQTGTDVEFYRANFYSAMIPDTELQAVFKAETYDEELAMSVLQEEEKCQWIQGNLGQIMENVTSDFTTEEFLSALMWENGIAPEFCMKDGAGTAYYIGSQYISIRFDSDGDAVQDATLEISMDESETIGPESYTWIYS